MSAAAGGGPRSRALFRRAERVLAGGVDSPVRSFSAVGGTPVVVARGEGAYLVDVDGRRYIDLVNSWGANLLGHAPAPVRRALARALRTGISFGAPTPAEHELAERIRRAVPEMERMRFVSSGTEATMTAVRLARAYTRRDLVVKFEGGYHGHSDGLLAVAGSGVATQAIAGSAGVPRSVLRGTRVLPYNDLPALDRLFEAEGDRVAAVLVEPIAGNMGVVPATRPFLRRIERWCRTAGALAIADEVITGFRLRRGIVSPSLGLTPDLVTLGKIVGGGMPIGVYGGRAEVLAQVAPTGPVYQAGTLAGHPLAMAAGAAMLDAVRPALYDRLDRLGASLARGWEEAAEAEGIAPLTVTRVGSMLSPFFAEPPIRAYRDAVRTDRDRYRRFFHGALAAGVYLPPSPLETAFLSAAMRPSTIAGILGGIRKGLRAAGEGTHR
ncbi:MAG: glutamate-1-semialdehyde 2,1-aminomutase [Thermoplasmata archaeon]